MRGVRAADIAGVKLAHWRPDWRALIHRSTQEPGRWQVTWFDAEGAFGHTTRDTIDECIKSERCHGWRFDEVLLRERETG